MPIVAQKIEIKANNKFKTYCRKAFGVSRFVYNWCVEKFTEDYKQYISDLNIYYKELRENKTAPLLHSQITEKPKLPSNLDYKKEFNSKKKKLYPFTYEVTKYASQQPFINFGRAVTNYIKAGKEGKRKH